jgi:hypothetical protein
MSQLPGSPRRLSFEDISAYTAQAETTILGAYLDLLPYATELVPSRWAKAEVIKSLPTHVKEDKKEEK